MNRHFWGQNFQSITEIYILHFNVLYQQRSLSARSERRRIEKLRVAHDFFR
jgi:hypothetical protein